MSYPTEIIESESSLILKKMYRIPHHNNGMIIIVIIGRPNSGKSYAGLWMCRILDKNFSVENIVFSAGQFIKNIIDSKGKGNAIMFDDAGIALFRRDAMTKEVKEMAKVFQSYRFKNCITVVTLPNLKDLENVVVSVSDALINMKRIDRNEKKSKGVVKWISVNAETGKVYKKFTSKTIYSELANGMLIKRKMKEKYMFFGYPDKALIKSYESKKQKYLNNYYLKTAKMFSDSPEGIAEKKKARRQGIFSELFEKSIPVKKIFMRNGKFDVVKIMAYFSIGESLAQKIRRGLELHEEGEI